MLCLHDICCVCPSVTSRNLLKWLNVESHKQRLTINRPGTVGEIGIGSPSTEAPKTGGYVTIVDFLPVSFGISEMVKDRNMVTMEG